MHFVIGGAFQGKRKWAKRFYGLEKRKHVWICSYNNEPLPRADNILETIVVIEGLEIFIRQRIGSNSSEDRQYWQEMFQQWKQWEREDNERKVIWIGCEIGHGVVPISELERRWRDLTGWCYQDLVKNCNRVDWVWCGLSETIK